MTNTTTWFKAWFGKIAPVEVSKSTDKTVTVREYWRNSPSADPVVRERKHLRQAGYEAYFPTWEEAHQHLLINAESKLLASRRALEVAQSEYGNVKGMKPPKEP